MMMCIVSLQWGRGIKNMACAKLIAHVILFHGTSYRMKVSCNTLGNAGLGTLFLLASFVLLFNTNSMEKLGCEFETSYNSKLVQQPNHMHLDTSSH